MSGSSGDCWWRLRTLGRQGWGQAKFGVQATQPAPTLARRDTADPSLTGLWLQGTLGQVLHPALSGPAAPSRLPSPARQRPHHQSHTVQGTSHCSRSQLSPFPPALTWAQKTSAGSPRSLLSYSPCPKDTLGPKPQPQGVGAAVWGRLRG